MELHRCYELHGLGRVEWLTGEQRHQEHGGIDSPGSLFDHLHRRRRHEQRSERHGQHRAVGNPHSITDRGFEWRHHDADLEFCQCHRLQFFRGMGQWHAAQHFRNTEQCRDYREQHLLYNLHRGGRFEPDGVHDRDSRWHLAGADPVCRYTDPGSVSI